MAEKHLYISQKVLAVAICNATGGEFVRAMNSAVCTCQIVHVFVFLDEGPRFDRRSTWWNRESLVFDRTRVWWAGIMPLPHNVSTPALPLLLDKEDEAPGPEIVWKGTGESVVFQLTDEPLASARIAIHKLAHETLLARFREKP